MEDATALAINYLQEFERGFELSMRARNRSPRTIKSYMEAIRLFRAFLEQLGMPTVTDRRWKGW